MIRDMAHLTASVGKIHVNADAYNDSVGDNDQ